MLTNANLINGLLAGMLRYQISTAGIIYSPPTLFYLQEPQQVVFACVTDVIFNFFDKGGKSDKG